MIFDKTVYIGDVINLLSICLVVAGGIFGFIQWKNSLKMKRAEYINELTEKIRTDEDMRDVVYIIDYNSDWYDAAFHNGGEIERKMDKTLSYFSYICYLHKNNVLKEKEFDFFKYEIKRILINKQIQNYFYNLYHFAKKCGEPITFIYLFEYGQRLNLFDKEFFNSRSKNYIHILNF